MSNDSFEEAPFLSNIGFMLTYKCTIACPHCIVKAGPHRTEEMKIESAFNWLDQIRSSRDGSVIGISLTGGEPFYNMDLLINIADYASKSGFIISVVTNGFWASTKTEALRILDLCSSISMISVSTDSPHLEQISFNNVSNAIWAAKKLGKLYSISVATENELTPDYLDVMDRVLEITDKEYVNTAFILPVGRAAKNAKYTNYQLSSEPAVTACQMANFPIIFPNGNVIACIGPPITLPTFNPLFLGNLNNESIEKIFERSESNYVLHSIRTFGPKVIVDLLREHDHSELLPLNYIKDATCDICYKLLSNRAICDLLNDLIMKDEKFRLKTAYGRYYFLHEASMIENEMQASDFNLLAI